MGPDAGAVRRVREVHLARGRGIAKDLLFHARHYGAWIVLAALLSAATGEAPREERLWHHRNLGKAFYENPTTQHEAVAELEKALDLAPGSARERLNYGLALLKAGRTAEGIRELEAVQKQVPEIPHTWFNLGIAYKQESRYEKALEQFERMAALVPDEPITQYNLGVLYKLTEKPELALPHFERAADLSSYFAAPRFQLFNAYRQAGRTAEAQTRKQEYDAIKEAQKGAAIPEDVDWSWYSELLDEIDPVVGTVPPAEVSFAAAELARGIEGLAVLDADGDLAPDLLAWSKAGVSLFRKGETAAGTGLEELRNVTGAAAGDFDNDGLADLCILTADGAALYRNAGGSFQKAPAQLPAGSFRLAFWLDFDHDYDLDLVLLGEGAALVRNQGEAGWSDETRRFPFVSGRAVSGTVVEAVADTQGVDLAVTYAGRPAVLYRDRLGGRYEAVELPGPGDAVVAQDVDQDGWSDLLSSASLLLNRRSLQGVLEKAEVSVPALPLAFADLEGRGMSDLVAGDGLHRNEGRGRLGEAKAAPGFPAVAAVAADFDADGREDLAVVGKDGVLRRLLNRTPADHWLRIGLEGVKNLKLAPGAEVEVKAGASYQKKIYRGFPLTFGLGVRSAIDAVRITWPNGLIQNEMKLTVDRAVTFKEAPRLSGSCPMIFTWNGERFQFITDVLGVAPLGASAGDGEYFPVDHDEYVQIPGEALAEVDGRYEIRVTEELREVAYLDQMRLIALDHPAVVEVFTNDKFKSPPFPDFRLFGVEERVYPVRATDDHGNDVRPRLLARDQVYPDGFRRDLSGVAELHHLDLDFGPGGSTAPDNRAVLVLSGWVDWADGSTFLGAAQASPSGLVFPRLQVKDGQGRWQTVIEDMGLPAGKPKTIAVDLTGKFLSASREVRIETSLCLYWDEVFLSAESGEPPAERTDLAPSLAELRYRGFSRPVIHPERRQPESFDYHSWMPVSMWNPTPGVYTRYGDVRPLLEEMDDRLLIMGSGDEVRLLFDAEALAALAPGWRRDFLLLVDGWAKDGDANTAFSQTVEPLPFHGMSRYPYPEGEGFPDDEAHRLYRERYNTRPALRLLRPLTG
ncbi:MAG: FG-GAP-like repeat-containing protein, partial [Thermoanaerobaculia bacterium]